MSLQSDWDDQLFFSNTAAASSGDVAGLGGVGGKQQNENLAGFQRLQWRSGQVPPGPDMRVIPGPDAFGLKLGMQQPRPGLVRAPG